MAQPVVYFDEAGNTGAALLDRTQPVFVLASTCLGNDECAELLALVKSTQSAEAKFATLRRSARGRQKILDFFASPILFPERIKIMVTHKRYMVVTKLVDIIEETLAHATGIDIYERGANLALSNLRYFATPIFCGEKQFEEFLDSFVAMIRFKDAASKHRFFVATRVAYENCSNNDFKDTFSPYLFAERHIDDILDGVDFHTLDPAIPSFFVHCTHWGAQLNEEFKAIHDNSKPMIKHKEIFEAMMDKSIPHSNIGYDRRKFDFPLKASSLHFEDSKKVLGLQVADILAGATAYYATSKAHDNYDEFFYELERVGIQHFTFDALLWPSVDVTPEALGTEEVGGINAANHIANIFSVRKI